ncbi:MAG TPA: Flp family type IVb pilin [Acidimicrobiales bacterium]|nr:Flp family type IVb pilin [Acidimicrobiales bacterium]
MLTKVAQLQATLRAFVASRLATTENGASLVEYALLLALIAVVAIGALLFLGHGVNNTLQNVGQNLANP